MKSTRSGREPSTGVPSPSPGDTPRLCACGCGESCRSTYIRGHNLRKDSRKKPKPEPEPESPAFAWDFGQPTWITDFPARLNHAGTGTEIYSPAPVKIGSAHFHLTENVVTSLTSDVTFTEAIQCEETGRLIPGGDGRILWHVVKAGRKSAIIYEGRISVLSTFQAYKITPGRTLTPLEWSRMVEIRAVNKGGFTRERTIAAMDFEQQRARAKWIDALDVSASGRVNDIKIYIRTLRSTLGDDGLAIHGQGPIFHEGSRIFVSSSVVFDDEGNIRDDIRVDLTGILPEMYAYYDITPPGEITEDEIRQGCEELILSYEECPADPEIPAAFLGQNFTVPITGIDPRFFSALLMTGVKGSGKSYYAARHDSIQSRKLRGHLKSVPPILNLGDTTGTEKGPKYRVKEFSGFAITSDDVIKAGDSPAHIVLQSDKVSNLIRSFEAGGAAIAGVDYSINEVVSRQSGALHTSMRVLSELPITGESTLDRMIVLPHLSEPWGKGGIFDKKLSLRLSSPESREIQHRAWSAFVFWLFQRQSADLEECYELAAEETASWKVESRYADRYAVLVTGHYLFSRFCNAHDIDASDAVSRAVKALQVCALRQAERTVSPAIAARKLMQLMQADGKLAFPGAPEVNPDGSESSSYSDPRLRIARHNEEDGSDYVEFKLPPGIARLSELGLILTAQGTPVPNSTAKVYGYVVPPRKDKGGKAGSGLSRKWSIAVPTRNQEPLCNALTEYGKTRGGTAFDINTLVRSLEKEGIGGRAFRTIADSPDPDIRKKIKQERIVEIDFEWLHTSESEEN
jgi:hypothetical protein